MKGIILSHEDGGSFVLTKDGGFEFVNGYTDIPISSEITISRAGKLPLAKILSLAACLILVVGLGAFGFIWNSVSYYIDVDINPSVEISVNRFDRVLEVTGVNEDGIALLEGFKPKGSALEVLTRITRMGREFVEEKNEAFFAVITIVSDDTDKAVGLAHEFESRLEGSKGIDFSVFTRGMDEHKLALQSGQPPGRIMIRNNFMGTDSSLDVSVTDDTRAGGISPQKRADNSAAAKEDVPPSHEPALPIVPHGSSATVTANGGTKEERADNADGSAGTPVADTAENPNRTGGYFSVGEIEVDSNTGGNGSNSPAIGEENAGSGVSSDVDRSTGDSGAADNPGDIIDIDAPGNSDDSGSSNDPGDFDNPDEPDKSGENENNGGTNNGGTNNGGTNNGNGDGNNGGTNNGGTNNGNGDGNNGGTNNGGTNNGNGDGNNGGTNNGGTNNGGTNNGGTNNGNGDGNK